MRVECTNLYYGLFDSLFFEKLSIFYDMNQIVKLYGKNKLELEQTFRGVTIVIKRLAVLHVISLNLLAHLLTTNPIF